MKKMSVLSVILKVKILRQLTSIYPHVSAMHVDFVKTSLHSCLRSRNTSKIPIKNLSNLHVMGLNISSSPEKTKKFMTRNSIPYPHYSLKIKFNEQLNSWVLGVRGIYVYQ